jgi:hypothetical protein
MIMVPLIFYLPFNEKYWILVLDKRVAAFQQANLQFKITGRVNATL